jgi:hypothetical protein
VEELRQKHGNQWKRIAAEMPGRLVTAFARWAVARVGVTSCAAVAPRCRTENAIKNRFYSFQRRQDRLHRRYGTDGNDSGGSVGGGMTLNPMSADAAARGRREIDGVRPASVGATMPVLAAGSGGRGDGGRLVSAPTMVASLSSQSRATAGVVKPAPVAPAGYSRGVPAPNGSKGAPPAPRAGGRDGGGSPRETQDAVGAYGANGSGGGAMAAGAGAGGTALGSTTRAVPAAPVPFVIPPLVMPSGATVPGGAGVSPPAQMLPSTPRGMMPMVTGVDGMVQLDPKVRCRCRRRRRRRRRCLCSCLCGWRFAMSVFGRGGGLPVFSRGQSLRLLCVGSTLPTGRIRRCFRSP